MATGRKRFGSFLFVPPVRYAPPVTEHVPLHSNTLCNYIACANNMHPLSGGGGGGLAQTEKIQRFISSLEGQI